MKVLARESRDFPYSASNIRKYPLITLSPTASVTITITVNYRANI